MSLGPEGLLRRDQAMLSAANVTLLGQMLEENDLYASPFQKCKGSYSHDSDALYVPEQAASSPVVYPRSQLLICIPPFEAGAVGTHRNSVFSSSRVRARYHDPERSSLPSLFHALHIQKRHDG